MRIEAKRRKECDYKVRGVNIKSMGVHDISFPFCPNPECALHQHAEGQWFLHAGYHSTKAFGKVARFRCRMCKKTFSTQSFSLDYYAKKRVSYWELMAHHCASESLRALSRIFR